MKELKGTTVEELIAQLQKLPPKMLVVTEAGETTVLPMLGLDVGVVYQFMEGKPHGMSKYLHVNQKHVKDLDAKTRKAAVPAVWIR